MDLTFPAWFPAPAVSDLSPISSALPQIILQKNALDKTPSALHAYANAKILIVGDQNTFAATGMTAALLPNARIVALDNPHADDLTVRHVMQQAQGCGFLLAVGSGTVNDLGKYASAQLGIPYAVVATAASMNGYASANASITVHEHKKTLPAHMPVAIIGDLGVIAAAPSRLTRSGLGDMLCRPCVQADWLLSHLLLGTTYDPRPFAWLAPLEAKLIEHASALGQSDESAIETLMQALILSGLAMSHCGGSYPASQGEHMIAHYMEMAHARQLPPSYHGEQVGVCSLYMLERQQSLLAGESVRFAAPQDDHFRQLEHDLGAQAAREARAAFAGKEALVHKASAPNWRDVRTAIRAIHTTRASIEQALVRAGGATKPSDLGWPEEAFNTACALARYTRERVTFLDLVSN